MSHKDFINALEIANPYFGPFMSCRKSWPHIYWYQQKLVKYLSGLGELERLAILEIGSWAGASTYSWCNAISKYFDGRGDLTCVDVWDRNIEPVQAEPGQSLPDMLDVFIHNVAAGGFADQVRHIKSPSDEAYKILPNRSFDLVYIDGDHSYGQVLRDIEHGLEVLNPGGIMCGDDLEIQADAVQPELLEIHSEIGDGWAVNPETGDGYHAGVTRAVSETLGRVSSWHGFWAVKINKLGTHLLDIANVDASIPRPLLQYNNEGEKEFEL